MLLDTSGLLCYVDAGDARHADAVTLFDAAPRKFTHSYVLAELIPLARSRGHDLAAVLAFSGDLIDSPLVEVVWVDEFWHRAALALLRSRPDKTYSLCDAA